MTMQKQPEGMSRKARGEPVTHPQTGRALPPEEYDIFDGKDKVGITRRAANGKGWHGLADGVPLPANELPPAFKTHGEAMGHIREQRSHFPAAAAAEPQEPEVQPVADVAPEVPTDDADTVATEGEVIQVILVDEVEADVVLEAETPGPPPVPQHDAEPVAPEPQQMRDLIGKGTAGDSDVQPDAYVDALAADTVPEYEPDEDDTVYQERHGAEPVNDAPALEPSPGEQPVHPRHAAHHEPKVTQAPEQATADALAPTDDWLLEPPKVEQEVTTPATEDDRFPFA